MFFDTKGAPVQQSVQDTITGETIVKVPLPGDVVKSIEQIISMHRAFMDEYLRLSIQLDDITAKKLEDRRQMGVLDMKVRTTLDDVVRRMKLDKKKPWGYNFVEKVMEYREPPVVAPLVGKENDKVITPEEAKPTEVKSG